MCELGLRKEAGGADAVLGDARLQRASLSAPP